MVIATVTRGWYCSSTHRNKATQALASSTGRSTSMDVLRPVLLANACVALFLCVDEQYQPLVTVAITIGVLARTYMGRGHMAAKEPQVQAKEA